MAGQFRLDDVAQLSERSPVGVQPGRLTAVRGEWEHEVTAVGRDDTRGLHRRDHQALVAKCFPLAIPSNHDYPDIWRRAKTREVDVGRVVRITLVDPDCLDLDSKYPAGLLLEDTHLRRLERG